MEPELIKAQRYRRHALELEMLAAQETHEELKCKLLELAAQYDELCNRIVRRRLATHH